MMIAKKPFYYRSLDGFLRYVKMSLTGREPMALYHFIEAATYQFQLTSTERNHFVSSCVERCVQIGAVPCEPGAPIYQEEWVADPKYGSTPAEIHQTVMAEWVDAGAPKVAPWTGVWFGLPSQVVPLNKATPRAQ